MEVKDRIFVERQAVPTFRPKEIGNRRIFPPLTTIFTSYWEQIYGCGLARVEKCFSRSGLEFILLLWREGAGLIAIVDSDWLFCIVSTILLVVHCINFF